jgi:hypothetical protein
MQIIAILDIAKADKENSRSLYLVAVMSATVQVTKLGKLKIIHLLHRDSNP